MPGDAQSILDAAVAGAGALATKGVPGTSGGELACAYAVSQILNNAGLSIKPTLSTDELYTELKGAGFVEVDPNTPGAVIISPTAGSRHGHTGVVGMDGKVYSNSSRDGVWEQNYTTQSWTDHFSDLGVHALLPGGSAAAATHPSIGPAYEGSETEETQETPEAAQAKRQKEEAPQEEERRPQMPSPLPRPELAPIQPELVKVQTNSPPPQFMGQRKSLMRQAPPAAAQSQAAAEPTAFESKPLPENNDDMMQVRQWLDQTDSI